MCRSNDIYDKNKKYWSPYWGSTAKTKSTRDKANISNPKENRGCAPTHSQPHLSRLCTNFTWTLNTLYSTGGLPYWGIQHYAQGLVLLQWYAMAKSLKTLATRRGFTKKTVLPLAKKPEIVAYRFRNRGYNKYSQYSERRHCMTNNEKRFITILRSCMPNNKHTV